MEFLYVKVDKRTAATLGLADHRESLPDGKVLLNQKDIWICSGENLEEKASNIGGVLLTEEEAISLLNETRESQPDTPEKDNQTPQEQ